MTDETKDVLARLEAKTRNTGNVSFMQAYEGGPWVHKSILAADPLCAEAAALIRAKDAENARLVAERDILANAGNAVQETSENWRNRSEAAEAALATERTACLAAEERVAELFNAMETADGYLDKGLHEMARNVTRAALKAPRATMTNWPLDEGEGSIIVGQTKDKPHD